MLSSNRRKIREVDVEVVTPGDGGAIDPVSGHGGASNGQEPESSAEERSAADRDRRLSSLLPLGLRRTRAKDEAEPQPPTAPEEVTDHPEETEGHAVAAEVAAADEALEETPLVEPVADAPAETPEAAETPMSTEPPQVEEPIQRPLAPAERTPSAKARVVWTAPPATEVSRGHTLKLTKPAPAETPQSASVRPKPVAKPPVEKPSGATPPLAAKAPEPVQKPLPAAPPPPSDEPVHEAAAAPAPPAEQTCDILFWRGYRKAAFYGRTFDETGEPVAVAESPFFRPQGNGIPGPTDAAKAAYEALRSQLIAAGWKPVGAGDDWFDEKFRLTVAAEPGPE